MDKQVWFIITAVAIITAIGFFAFQGMNDDEHAEPPAGEETQNENEQQDTTPEQTKNPEKENHQSVQHMDYTGEVAPKFSAEDLAAAPTDNWITNGGDLYNRRYSPLEQIDTSNIGDLKLEWVTSLGSGLEFKYSGESTPLVYDGVMFNVTGANVVQALDATTGEIIWEYTPQLADGLDTACCGWISRGVAIGDEKVYVGLLDSRLVALDQETGDVVWETPVAEWEKGYTITSAPLYYNGKVYTGVAGGEYGIRGFLAAYDSNIGREVWRTYTIPAPGEPGSETWPDDNDSWLTGGGPIWQTPAVDPELNMIYFSTGNASPDLDGSNRQGDNLYANSMLALDADTGEYQWHFQQVHHDIWDLDPANPVTLFDVEIDGETRNAIAETGKTGWVYILDRTNGEPLIGIEEQPVPQDERQKTSPTQPYPIGDALVPQSITEEDVERDFPEDFEGKVGDLFTPFWDEPLTITPSPQGGGNWPPSAYNPDTELYYVQVNSNYFAYAHNEEDEANIFDEGKEWIGSIWQPLEGGPQHGLITAVDVKTNTIAWQEEWETIAFSGLLTTKGNLLFAGHNDGRLIAYNATTGEQLWEFMTDAGVNAPAMTYSVDGKQYISVFAAGNSLAGTTHGDKIYTFSLEGEYTSLEDVPEDAINTSPTAEEQDTDNQENEGQTGTDGGEVAEQGLKVYENNCLSCHGANGVGGHNGPNLENLDMTDEELIEQIKHGGGGMPPFEGVLTEEQIEAVKEYLKTLMKE